MFSSFFDVQKAHDFIKEKVESGGTKKAIPKRATVSLSPAQLDFIEKRKNDVLK